MSIKILENGVIKNENQEILGFLDRGCFDLHIDGEPGSFLCVTEERALELVEKYKKIQQALNDFEQD